MSQMGMKGQEGPGAGPGSHHCAPVAAPNPCEANGGRGPCSHLCLINYNRTLSCACPHLMKLDKDNTTCYGRGGSIGHQGWGVTPAPGGCRDPTGQRWGGGRGFARSGLAGEKTQESRSQPHCSRPVTCAAFPENRGIRAPAPCPIPLLEWERTQASGLSPLFSPSAPTACPVSLGRGQLRMEVGAGTPPGHGPGVPHTDPVLPAQSSGSSCCMRGRWRSAVWTWTAPTTTTSSPSRCPTSTTSPWSTMTPASSASTGPTCAPRPSSVPSSMALASRPWSLQVGPTGPWGHGVASPWPQYHRAWYHSMACSTPGPPGLPPLCGLPPPSWCHGA